jgi:hypothetical protein
VKEEGKNDMQLLEITLGRGWIILSLLLVFIIPIK